MPTETKIPIRLEHAISTEKNSPGDSFTAWLDGPLMVAMRNATDAAKEMIDDLTLVFNKARQAAITSELALNLMPDED